MAQPTIKLVECPRDAWQALPQPIPAEVKADYLRLLVAAGFRHIDAVSFVSPKAVPQMADSEKVLAFLQEAEPVLLKNEVEIIGIVVNTKGAARAINAGGVKTLGFPYSISPEFLKRNQNQTPEESIDALEAISQLSYHAGMGLTAYVSMAFGNPYGDAWDEDEVVAACDLLADSGVDVISLADTVGLATPRQIEQVVSAALAAVDSVEIGVHLHGTPENAAAKIRAAYSAGCRRFDSALAGLGGCPFAQDALVGNIPTEVLLETLGALGATLPELMPLDELITASKQIARKYGAIPQ
jgi:hydroxymethylglutaryl-CoA lyase